MKIFTRQTGMPRSQRYHICPEAEPGYVSPRALCGTIATKGVRPGRTLCPTCSKRYLQLCAEGAIEYDPLPFTILGKVAS